MVRTLSPKSHQTPSHSLLQVPRGEQWVCEQRHGPGLAVPRHRFKQQDVLLCQGHDHRPVLLAPSFQLDLRGRQHQLYLQVLLQLGKYKVEMKWKSSPGMSSLWPEGQMQPVKLFNLACHNSEKLQIIIIIYQLATVWMYFIHFSVFQEQCWRVIYD